MIAPPTPANHRAAPTRPPRRPMLGGGRERTYAPIAQTTEALSTFAVIGAPACTAGMSVRPNPFNVLKILMAQDRIRGQVKESFGLRREYFANIEMAEPSPPWMDGEGGWASSHGGRCHA